MQSEFEKKIDEARDIIENLSSAHEDEINEKDNEIEDLKSEISELKKENDDLSYELEQYEREKIG